MASGSESPSTPIRFRHAYPRRGAFPRKINDFALVVAARADRFSRPNTDKTRTGSGGVR